MVTTPSLDFHCIGLTSPILMIVVLEDRYESPLSIDTTKSTNSIALHLMSQSYFNDVRVKKKFMDFG